MIIAHLHSKSVEKLHGILAELPPGKRTICTPTERFFLHFPYLYFIATYERFYHKYFFQNLMVGASNEPIQTIDQSLGIIPTMNTYDANVCLGESMPQPNKSIEESTKDAIHAFFSSPFYGATTSLHVDTKPHPIHLKSFNDWRIITKSEHNPKFLFQNTFKITDYYSLNTKINSRFHTKPPGRLQKIRQFFRTQFPKALS